MLYIFRSFYVIIWYLKCNLCGRKFTLYLFKPRPVVGSLLITVKNQTILYIFRLFIYLSIYLHI
jgi:hypothetical protein